MSIVLVGSTSGSITLQEPAVAGSTVLDLPAVSGTILTTTSPKAGNVIQVVQGSFSGTSSTTSTSMVSTSLNASITPTSSSSKILILVAGSAASGSLNEVAILTIYRSSTNLASASFTYHANPVAGLNNWQSVNMVYLDSPSTTSSTTYTVYLKSTSGSATAYLGTGANTNTITLMEIAA